MAILGSNDFSTLLAKNLDLSSLVSLCQDLLFRRGHSKIRRTDGPGDGGRDIFSKDIRGRPHLVQSKYHQNKDAVCSSADLSELPIALIKLGYSTGLFVTNSRISPQAKREYLDNYPSLELEFIDGDSLVATVVSDALLQALWFDGVSISQANAKLVFPLLIRKFPGDRPAKLTADMAKQGLATLGSKHPKCRFELIESDSDLQAFPLYRPPNPPSVSEGLMAVSQILELHIEHGAEISIAPKLPKAICESLLPTLREHDCVFTMRVGQPWLLPLQTTHNTTRVLTDLTGFSYTLGPASMEEEAIWFSCRKNSHWDIETDARMTEAAHIRLFNHELNCALSYEITCNAWNRPAGVPEAFTDLWKKAWRKSLFCLLPHWGEVWPHEVIEPDQFSDWQGTGKMLCGWFHRNLKGGIISLGNSEEPGPFTPPLEQEEDARLNELKAAVSRIDCVEILNADKARHMVAAIGDDPFPSKESEHFHTGELANYFNECVPSPINPSSREFCVTIAWEDCDLDEAQFKNVIVSAVNISTFPSSGRICVDRLDDFIAATLEYIPSSLVQSSTNDLLEEIHLSIISLIDALEGTQLLGKKASRCTKKYWQMRWNVMLGTSWNKSTKAYAWRQLPNGDYKPLDTADLFGGSVPE